MKQYFLQVIGLATCIGLVALPSMAQDKQEKNNTSGNEEIIIRKKGDKDTKVTVEIHGDDVIVNGKPLADFDDENVVIRKRKPADGPATAYAPAAPRSPFRGGTWNYSNNGLSRIDINDNRAFLGVLMTNDERGAKITSVTKGSAADNAGLKEGDVITRVNDAKVEDPGDLTEAIAKYKPEDKVTISYQRNNKDAKTMVTLGRKKSLVNLSENLDLSEFNRDFNFDFNSPGTDGYNLIMRSNNPRLGIKAQDTEDGKGVKVLDVDEGSNAQKAGIKEDDVLTEFDGKPVNSATELAEAARNAKDKNTVKVKLLRNGKTQELEIRVPRKLKTATL